MTGSTNWRTNLQLSYSLQQAAPPFRLDLWPRTSLRIIWGVRDGSAFLSLLYDGAYCMVFSNVDDTPDRSSFSNCLCIACRVASWVYFANFVTLQTAILSNLSRVCKWICEKYRLNCLRKNQILFFHTWTVLTYCRASKYIPQTFIMLNRHFDFKVIAEMCFRTYETLLSYKQYINTRTIVRTTYIADTIDVVQATQ